MYPSNIVRSPGLSKKHPKYTAPGMRDGAGVLVLGGAAGVPSLGVGAGVLGMVDVAPHDSNGS